VPKADAFLLQAQRARAASSTCETRHDPATDLSGAGAARNPGRWNEDGQPVLYTAVIAGSGGAFGHRRGRCARVR